MERDHELITQLADDATVTVSQEANDKLRRQLQEVLAHTAQLEREHCRFQEVQTALVAEEQEISHQLAEAMDLHHGLEHRLQTGQQRLRAVEEELEDLNQALPLLEHRAGVLQNQDQQLGREVRALEVKLRATRQRRSATHAELELVYEAIARMDQKLLLKGLKR